MYFCWSLAPHCTFTFADAVQKLNKISDGGCGQPLPHAPPLMLTPPVPVHRGPAHSGGVSDTHTPKRINFIKNNKKGFHWKGHLSEWHKFEICSTFQWRAMGAERKFVEMHGLQSMVFGQKGCLTTIQCFWPKSDRTNFGKQGYHRKEHLKRSRMAQISAP